MRWTETPPLLIAMLVGSGLLLAAFYSLRALDPPMSFRIGLGAVLLVTGAYITWFNPGVGALVKQPLLFGLAAFLVGFGINQLAAPLRRAMGKQP